MRFQPCGLCISPCPKEHLDRNQNQRGEQRLPSWRNYAAFWEFPYPKANWPLPRRICLWFGSLWTSGRITTSHLAQRSGFSQGEVFLQQVLCPETWQNEVLGSQVVSVRASLRQMNKTLPHYNGSNPTMLLQSDSWLQFCAYAVSWMKDLLSWMNWMNWLIFAWNWG